MKSSFDKIAGYKSEKKELMDICNIIKRRDDLKKAGGKLPKGLFLFGPCGVGKTVLARAFIEESRCPCVEISTTDIDEDNYTDYLKEKFKEAASKAPCILFIDELDKFAGMNYHVMMPTDCSRSQDLLNEINKYSNVEGLFLLLIANSDHAIDAAILRSGRIDKKITVSYPNELEREEIIKYYSKNKRFDDSINFSNLAKITDYLTGADLESLVNDAVIKATINNHAYVGNDDLMDAYNDKIFNCKDKDYELPLEDQKILAIHEAGHAAISLLNDEKSVYCATIIQRGKSRGYMVGQNTDRKMQTTQDVENEAKVSLAGMAAEDVFMNIRTTGSSSDIRKAQDNIRRLVRVYGAWGLDLVSTSGYMNEYGHHVDDCSEYRKRMLEEQEANVLQRLYQSVVSDLKDNKPLVEAISDALVAKKVLHKDEISSIYKLYQQQKMLGMYK